MTKYSLKPCGVHTARLLKNILPIFNIMYEEFQHYCDIISDINIIISNINIISDIYGSITKS